MNKPNATRGDKPTNADRVVKIIRVYESGRVSAAGRPPRSWDGWNAKGRAHALPESPTAGAPAVKAKDPKKVAAGRARAAQAAQKKAAALQAAQQAAAQDAAKAVKAAKAPKPARGGARPNTGPKPQHGEAMVVVAFRVTPEQKAKLEQLGNGKFMRERIERAVVPAGK